MERPARFSTPRRFGALIVRRSAATPSIMGRLLAAMLIFCLAFSHGRVGAAVPHLDGSHHHDFELVQVDDHDHASIADLDHSDESSDAAPDERDGKTFGHHSHNSADGVPYTCQPLPQIASNEIRERPVDDPALRPIALDPLSEPPSA